MEKEEEVSWISNQRKQRYRDYKRLQEIARIRKEGKKRNWEKLDERDKSIKRGVEIRDEGGNKRD